MEREQYLRLIRQAYELAFERDDLAAGASSYAEALGSLASGELAYSDHHSEYAAVLRKLGRNDDALAQSRLAVEAAMRESAGDSKASAVAIQSYFLGEHLIAMARPSQALEAVEPSLDTRSNVAPLLLMVQAEALAALGRMREARAAAAQATERASDRQRATVVERLRRALPQM